MSKDEGLSVFLLFNEEGDLSQSIQGEMAASAGNLAPHSRDQVYGSNFLIGCDTAVRGIAGVVQSASSRQVSDTLSGTDKFSFRRILENKGDGTISREKSGRRVCRLAKLTQLLTKILGASVSKGNELGDNLDCRVMQLCAITVDSSVVIKMAFGCGSS